MQFISAGDNLHFRRWWVEGARAVVVIAHGLGEHSGRYKKLALALNRSGYSVYALDHFGHGLSDGKRGHVDDFARYSTQLHEFIGLVRRDNAGIPVHLLGHSMGGLIACACAARYGDVDSLILSAPGFRGRNEPSLPERFLLGGLVRLLPRLTLPNRVDSRWLSRDPAVVEAYQADELVHSKVSLQWFSSFQRERDYAISHLGQITAPCLLLLPLGDQLVDSEFTLSLFDRLGSQHKRLHTFADAYHELFNEVDEGPVALELLLQHLTAQPAEAKVVASA